MKDVTIKCASGDERKVLTYIEKKYPNVRWRSGKMPTKVPDSYFYDEGTLININMGRLSCISATEPNYYSDPVVTAEKFLEKDSKPSIVIFQRGRNVIAKDVATGNEGIAKCSPNDEFNFHTGASIALARLMSKVPATGVLNPDVRAEWTKLLGITEIPEKVFTDADRNFKVGDYVTLKEGLAVGKKYGALTLYSGRMYECANGKRLEVETATFNELDGMYHYRCKATDGNYFYYTEAMLDTWNEGKIHEGDTVKVVNTGLNYSSYVQWVGEHISDPYMAARFCFGSPSTDEKYKVIKIAKHGRNDNDLAYIEEIDGISYNRCYLIEVKGLEKV